MKALAGFCAIPVILASMGFPADTREALVGSWRLVSWTDTSDGLKPYFPFGMKPVGQMLFTSDGRFAVQVQCDPEGAVPGSPPPDALEDSSMQYLGYFGTYSANPTDGTIAYKVLGASASFLHAADSRIFRFDGDRLIVTEQWTALHGRRWNSEEVLVRGAANGPPTSLSPRSPATLH